MASLELKVSSFLRKAQARWGDRFGYGELGYVSSVLPVTIVCSKHGSFQQTPSRHLSPGNKHGCPDCGRDYAKTINDNSHEEAKARKALMPCKLKTTFLKKATAKFGSSFDYQGIAYINGNVPITVVCTKHGPFVVKPNNHLSSKYGCCPQCILDNREPYLAQEAVLNRARCRHGDTLTYENSNYTGIANSLEVSCVKHGPFTVGSVATLLNTTPKGRACPSCNSERIASERAAKKHARDIRAMEHRSSSGSVGERLIRRTLRANNIEFVEQKTFPGCRSSNLLRFDFYLPATNTVIEFNGRQHYHAIAFFGGRSGLTSTRKRDIIKRNFCYDNGVAYEVIRYDQDCHTALERILGIALVRPRTRTFVNKAGFYLK